MNGLFTLRATFEIVTKVTVNSAILATATMVDHNHLLKAPLQLLDLFLLKPNSHNSYHGYAFAVAVTTVVATRHNGAFRTIVLYDHSSNL